MHEAGDSKPVLWDNTEGWGGEGGGRGVWDGGGVCAPVADPCQCVPGATTVLESDCPPIKINYKKKNNSFLVTPVVYIHLTRSTSHREPQLLIHLSVFHAFGGQSFS